MILGRQIARLRLLLAALVVSAASGCAPTAQQAPPQYPPRSFFVFFSSGSAALSPEALRVIDEIADESERIHATAVGIVGYSSPTGAPAVNLRLSEERSAAVEAALVQRKVDRAVIVRTYHGAVQDLAGSGLEGRRVEVVVSREERR